jgi:hypothetical protein
MRDHAIVGLHDLRAGGGASLLASIAAVEDDEVSDNKETQT